MDVKQPSNDNFSNLQVEGLVGHSNSHDNHDDHNHDGYVDSSITDHSDHKTSEYVAHDSEHHNDIPFFKTDIVLGISVWVVFFLLLIVLYFVAWKPILAILDAREKKIKDSLAKASEIEDKLIEVNESNHHKLVEAQHKAEELIENSQKEAQKVAEDIRKNAQNEAEKLINVAQEKINTEKEKALKEIERTSVDLAVQIVNGILKNKVTVEESLEFANRQLKNVE